MQNQMVFIAALQPKACASYSLFRSSRHYLRTYVQVCNSNNGNYVHDCIYYTRFLDGETSV